MVQSVFRVIMNQLISYFLLRRVHRFMSPKQPARLFRNPEPSPGWPGSLSAACRRLREHGFVSTLKSLGSEEGFSQQKDPSPGINSSGPSITFRIIQRPVKVLFPKHGRTPAVGQRRRQGGIPANHTVFITLRVTMTGS